MKRGVKVGQMIRFVLAAAVFLIATATESVALEGTESPTVRSRVEFWKLIFAKYGRNQVVFHLRDEPAIIFSVLDFSRLDGEYSPAEIKEIRKAQTTEEEARIRAELLQLSEGRAPTSPFGRRIQRLFQEHNRATPAKYRDAATEEQIRFQTGIREQYQEALKRSTRYLYAIERIFAQSGLPVEISRLPFVESSFNYEAYSSVGAAGIWQFMRETGKRYMRIDSVVDERRDPIIATRAAVQYLRRAYEVLDTWPLALTSYNHGVAGVARAVKQTGSKDLAVLIRQFEGSSFGFASKNFYASFLAALEIEREWQKYFPNVQREMPFYFDEVQLFRPVGYREALAHSKLSAEQFLDLNPALLSPITRGSVKIPPGVILKVPYGQGRRFAQAIGARLYSTSGPSSPVNVPPVNQAVRRDQGKKVFGAQVKKGEELERQNRSKREQSRSATPSTGKKPPKNIPKSAPKKDSGSAPQNSLP